MVRDSVELTGIRVYQQGESAGSYHFDGNLFDNIGFRPYFLWTFDTATLQADILNSSADNIGALGIYSAYANSDSILMQLSGSSKMDVVVDRYTYDNTDQVGGISNTGLEIFIPGPGFAHPDYWGNGAEATLKISNSSFSNTVTEAIQLNNVGLNSVMDIEITNTKIQNAQAGQIGPLLGFSDAAAVSVLPEFYGNSGSQAFLKVENSDIIGSTGVAVGVYDMGTAGSSTMLDMGGGPLGSQGQNRILGNSAGDILLYMSDGTGQNNWWGGGSPVVIGGGIFDFAPLLTSDPRP